MHWEENNPIISRWDVKSEKGVIPPIAMGCICYQSTHPFLGAQSMLDLDHLHQGRFYNYVGGGAQWV